MKNPEEQGESRDAGRRLLIEPPLGVVYRASESTLSSQVDAIAER